MLGGRDGSKAKSTASSSEGHPKFNSQQRHGGSQSSVMRSGALLRKRPGQLSSLIQTMKPNTDKFNRTVIYGLPTHASVLPGHTFHFNFFHIGALLGRRRMRKMIKLYFNLKNLNEKEILQSLQKKIAGVAVLFCVLTMQMPSWVHACFRTYWMLLSVIPILFNYLAFCSDSPNPHPSPLGPSSLTLRFRTSLIVRHIHG